MNKLFILSLLLCVIVIGCEGQPTTAPPTPTEAPQPTEEATTEPTTEATAEPTLAPTETTAPTEAATATVEVTNTEAATATEVPPLSPTAMPISGTVKATLNAREGPSTSSKLLGVLKKGDVVNILVRTDDSKWYQINFPLDATTTAWVISSLVDVSVTPDTIPVAAISGTPTGEATGTTTATGTATATRTATVTRTATITTTATTGTPTVTRTGTVTATVATTGTPQATTPAGALGTPPDRIIYDEVANGVLQISRVSGNGSGKTVLVPGGSQPALAPNGTTLAYLKSGTGIVTRSVSGGAETSLLCASDGRYPTWSSDGNNLAFNVIASNGSGQVFIGQIGCARTARTLVGIGFRPAWEPGLGRLILFDGCKASACGNLLTEPAFTPDPNNPTQVHGGQNGAWSPNGQQIAYQGTDANGHINVFVVNRDGSGARQITHGTHNDGVPIWSSDARWIYYRSDQNGTGWAIYAARADGSGSQKIIDATPGGDWTYAKLAISR